MTTPILLPPLPEPKGTCQEYAADGTPYAEPNQQFTADQLRARDLEVARVVLEGAAQEFDRRAPPGTGFYTPDEPAEIIRNLKIKHHE